MYYQRGDYPKAVEQLERALELARDDPTIAEHLADAYVKTGKAQDALRLYQEALGRSKEKDQVERLRAKIQGLQDGHADGGKDS